MNTIILYHANCADGFAAAFAAWLKFGDSATYIPVSYGQPCPRFPATDVAPTVYVLDFSYPPEELYGMLAGGAESVTVLDHHKTAEAQLHGLPDPVMGEKVSARFDMSKSGCVLAWEYFHPDKPVPPLLLYVQDRDLWKWKLGNSRSINAGLWRGYQRQFDLWELLVEDWRGECREIMHRGWGILHSDELMLDALSRHAEHVTPEPGGPLTLRVNSPVLQSELAERLLADDGLCEVVDVWWESNGHRHHTLRSRKGGVDVSQIASRHGGGGHPSAAGWVEKMNAADQRPATKTP